MSQSLNVDSLSPAIEDVEELGALGPEAVAQPLQPQAQLGPEDGAAEAVDQEPEGRVDGHEEA